jgi:hypothetical protein
MMAYDGAEAQFQLFLILNMSDQRQNKTPPNLTWVEDPPVIPE